LETTIIIINKMRVFFTKKNVVFIISLAVFFAIKIPSLKAQIESDLYGQKSGDLAGVSALMSAVASGDIEGVKFFSRAGGFLINQKNIGGATAIHIAARTGNIEITKILLANGADVNIADNEGFTPLMRASAANSAPIVDMLLDKNANAEIFNNSGDSAIILASLADCSDCINKIFTKSNLIKKMDTKLLKEQLVDSFIIARNRENQTLQNLLENYLDYTTKTAPLVSNTSTQPANETTTTIVDSQDDLKNVNIVLTNKGSDGKKYIFKTVDSDNIASNNSNITSNAMDSVINAEPAKPALSPTNIASTSGNIDNIQSQYIQEKVVKKFKFISGKQPSLNENAVLQSQTKEARKFKFKRCDCEEKRL